MARQEASSASEPETNDELEQITVARALLNYRLKEKIAMANNPTAPPFPKKFLVHPDKKPPSSQTSSSGSKILRMIRPRSSLRTPRSTDEFCFQKPHLSPLESQMAQPLKFHAAGAPPFLPFQHFRISSAGMAAPVTIRTSVPVFSAPPLPPPAVYQHLSPVMNSPWRVAPPVHIRPAVSVFAAPPALFPGKLQVSQIQVKEQNSASRVPGTQAKLVPGRVTAVEEEEKEELSLLNAVRAKEESPTQAKVEPAMAVSVQVKEEPCPVSSAQSREISKTEEASAEDPGRKMLKSEMSKNDFHELELLDNLRALEL